LQPAGRCPGLLASLLLLLLLLVLLLLLLLLLLQGHSAEAAGDKCYPGW
jgi:hypothetical protein